MEKDLILIIGALLAGLSVVTCDCEAGWREYYDNCYYFSDIRHRFSDYEHVCAARNASVFVWQSRGELDWVTNQILQGQRIMYWTGLKLVNRHWRWADGTPYSRTNAHWYRNQEGNTHSGDTCTAIYSYKPYEGQMRQQRCTSSWGSICVRPKDMLDFCDLANGWRYIDGRCLKFFDIPLPWFDARRTCQDHQGDLTIYKNYNQMLDLFEVVPCRSVEDTVWIGLSDTVQPRTWRWINNDTLSHYQHWYSYANQILQNGSTCAAADPMSSWSWRNYVCDTPLKFVCNRSIGVCPMGWLQNQDRCYQPNVVDTSRKTWFDAKTYCDSIGTSGGLLIINSDIEQQYITSTLHDLHVNRAWLAFSDFRASDVLAWTDDNAVVNSSRYQHWDSHYPQTDPKRFDCGIITSAARDARWSNGYCFNSEPFICEMKVTDRPFLKPPPPVTNHCDRDWILYLKNCYYFGPVRNQTTKTWNEAKSYCQATGGNLVVIGDPYEMSFVTVNQASIVTAWIGLSYSTANNQLTWVDGHVPGQNSINETNFAPGGSADVTHGKECIQIVGGQRGYSGAWVNNNCSVSQGFICEKTAYPGNNTQIINFTPSINSFSSQCGSGWIYDNSDNFCYQITLNSPKTWADARADCLQKGSDLASISGRREQNFLQGVLMTGVYASVQVNFWIGATDQSKEGGWIWTDGGPFRFLNWHPGEPNNVASIALLENCGEMVPSWGYQWNDKKCSIEQLYICKKQANLTQVATFTPPTAPPLTKSCVGEPMISGNYSLIDKTAFAASTSRDASHLPANSRWYQGSMGAWSARTSSLNQWISASFFSTIVVTGVTTAGRTDNDEWVTNYTIRYQSDYYSEWTTYNDPPGKPKVFIGNNDSSTPVTNMLLFPFEARAVMLVPMTWNTGISLRWEILGCLEEDCNPDYGVSGPLVVPDSNITASSEFDAGHNAASTRLHSIAAGKPLSCWRPKTSDANQWIQVDLGDVMVIRGITIRGDPYTQEWVTKFKLQYSIDKPNGPFTYYQEPYNQVKTMMGNTNNTTPMTYFFKAHFQGRYVRVIPVAWHNRYIALAFDVLVCPHGCKGVPLISGSNPLPDDKLSASTVLDDSYGPFRSRLNQPSMGTYAGAWIPRYQDTHQYLQIDLGYLVSVNGIATQGASDSQEWVMTYALGYSDDGLNWTPHFLTGRSPEVFDGNWDNNSVRKHIFPIPVLTRFVRLWPHSYHGRIAVRWEIYGCPGADSSKQIGCYSDDSHDHDLSYQPFTDPKVGMWPPMCIHHCFQRGYLYAGIQNQYKCFCGNSYGRYGPAADCTMSCVPRTDFFCGGPSSSNIYTTGLTPQFKVCPPNWKAYNGQCYILLLDERSWFDGRAACQSVGGELASPNSQHQQDFVYSLLQYGNGTDAWIGFNDIQDESLFVWTTGQQVKYTNWNLNQPRQQANFDEDCVVMTKNVRNSFFWHVRHPHLGGWQDETCDSAHQYVCQKDKASTILPSPTTGVSDCETGWDGFRWSCYLYADAPRSWQDAKSLCATFGGSLIRIEDRFEQAYISSVLGTRNGQYWTDVTDAGTPGSYQYSDGTSYVYFTNWAANKPDASSQCVYLGSGNVSGLWFNTACSTKLGTVCEKMRVGHTSPIPPSTTQVKIPCDQGLIPTDQYCYQVNVQPAQRQLTWSEALNDCSRKGATLAAFHNAKDLDKVWRSGLVGFSTWFWIGLRGSYDTNSQRSGSSDRVYKWTDQSYASYVNWGANQPDNYLGTENCVEMGPGTGHWNDANCYSRRNWICMIRRGGHFTLPTTITAPTAGSSSLCGSDTSWSYYNGYCYKANDGNGNTGHTWRQARAQCQKAGGDLASVLTPQEQQFIYQRLLMNISSYGVWIGLNELDTDRGYRWSDGSPVTFTAWDAHQPDNYNDAEDCATIQIRHGKWNDDHCATQYGFVCKMKVGTTPTPLAPTTGYPGFCPVGFNLLHNKCYRVYTQAVNWTGAKAICRGLGSGYDLASVQSDEENAFLVTLLSDMSLNPWLGMMKTWYNTFQWINQDDVTYTNFAAGEPNGRQNQCVQMYGIRTKAGQWLDNDCGSRQGFVCQTKKQGTLLTPEPTPNVCDVGQHYQQFKAGCYLFVNQPMTWTNASASCSQKGAALASINSPYEQAFIYVMVKQQHKMVPAIWTGLNDQQTPGTYMWSDNWPVMYTNWDQGQPVRSSDGGCVMFNNSGRWRDTDCKNAYPFICKITQAPPPLSPPPPNGTCDMGWYLYGSKCYFLEANQLRTVLDATLTCQQMGATLVSIHNKTVNDYLTHAMSLLAYQASSYWTSLHKSLDSGFMWVDGSALQFTNWRPGQPSTRGLAGNDENCAEVFLSDGKWNDEDCNSKRAFICEKPQAADTSEIKLGTGSGTVIRTPTPLPLTIPSILPPQLVPTLSRKTSRTISPVVTPSSSHMTAVMSHTTVTTFKSTVTTVTRGKVSSASSLKQTQSASSMKQTTSSSSMKKTSSASSMKQTTSASSMKQSPSASSMKQGFKSVSTGQSSSATAISTTNTGQGVTQGQTGLSPRSESPGTIAAIVIGAVVVVLLIVAIVMFWRRNSIGTRGLGFVSTEAGFENQTYRSGSTREEYDPSARGVALRTLSESST